MEEDTSSEEVISSTRPRLYNIVHTYIQKHLPRDVHPAFKALRDREEEAVTLSQVGLVEDNDWYLLTAKQCAPAGDRASGDEGGSDIPLEELYKDALSEKRLFRAAIKSYEDATKGSKYQTRISSDTMHTWEQVLTEVNTASERYNEVSGFWGTIRKSLRRFGDNNQVFDAWASLLPTQSQYLSILCGGLKLIFSAAGRLKDLRSEVCEALAEIPVLLTSTHRALGAFKRSKELHRCSADLYTATIAVLSHIVEWYKEKAIKKFSKSIFMQSSYEKKLSDLIQTLRIHSQRFESCAKLCAYESIRHTDDVVTSLDKDTHNNHQEIVGQLDRLKMEQFRQNNLLGNIVVTEAGNIHQMMGAMANRVENMSKASVKELIDNAVKEALENFLSSNSRLDYRTQDIRGPLLPIREKASESQLLRARHLFQQQLLTGLEYEDFVLQQDVAAKINSIWTLQRQDQDRVVAIMRSHKVQKWITGTQSSALLVNANYKGSAPQQPTSFICAKLVDSITPTPSQNPRAPNLTLPLAFFCGEHRKQDDPDSGPDGMMRNLVAQLLLSYSDFDLHTIRSMQQTLDYSSVNDLCDIFDLLIAQLPPYLVIFCIIDSISFFEDNTAVCEEATIAIRALVDVVERTKEGGCAFKLLLMSSQNSRILYKELVDQDNNVIWVPAKVPAQGGFTGMKWGASVDLHLNVTDSGSSH